MRTASFNSDLYCNDNKWEMETTNTRTRHSYFPLIVRILGVIDDIFVHINTYPRRIIDANKIMLLQ